MKAREYCILAVVLSSCVALLGAIGPSKPDKKTPMPAAENVFTLEPTKRQGDTLAGLTGVWVVVDYIRPEIQSYGLTRQILQTDVESQLMQNGIRVLPIEEMFKKWGYTYLFIKVGALIKEEIGFAAVSIRVEFAQVAMLLRQPSIIVDATTWEKSEVGMVPIKQLKDVRKDVKNLVAQFCNDYLAANPKEPTWHYKPKPNNKQGNR